MSLCLPTASSYSGKGLVRFLYQSLRGSLSQISHFHQRSGDSSNISKVCGFLTLSGFVFYVILTNSGFILYMIVFFLLRLTCLIVWTGGWDSIGSPESFCLSMPSESGMMLRIQL